MTKAPLSNITESSPKRRWQGTGAKRPKDLTSRYSRLVYFLKFIFPLIALGLAAMIIIWPQISGTDRKFRIESVRIDPDAPEVLEMLNARYSGTDKNGQHYDIKAKKALQKVGNANQIGMAQIDAIITLKNSGWIKINSDEGVYNREENSLELAGHVKIQHHAGYIFETAYAHVDLAMGTASGNMPAYIDAPVGKLEAQGFNILNQGDYVKFTGKTKLALYTDRMDKKKKKK